MASPSKNKEVLMRDAALADIVVCDLSGFESGPSCTETLAWLGANVIKVERPGTGEGARRAVGDPPGVDSWSHILLNANKKSVTADLKAPEGMRLVHRLIERSDVFIENFGPGVIDKIGLDYETVRAINPRIIYAQIKGFPSGSPWASFPAFDPVGQAAGGSVAGTGTPDGPPVRPGASIADSGAGLHCAIGILAALHQRERTGEGQRIEVSMQEAVMNFTRTAWQTYLATGQPAKRGGGDFRSAPNGLFPCKPFGMNDYVQVFTSRWPGGRHWERLLEVIGRSDLIGDERYATPSSRFERRDEVNALVTTWTSERTKVEAMQALGEAGIPASAVFDAADLADDQYLRERGMVVSYDHPVRGRVTIPKLPIQMSASSVPIAPAPLLGEHNEQVYSGMLGLPVTELQELQRIGAI
jgi:formyl-CoA transferase